MRNPIRRLLAERFAPRSSVPNIPSSLRQAAAAGFRPDLIFDVGASRGEFTRLCLGLWPESRVACFEPLAARVHDLEVLATGHHGRVTVHATLLGATEDAAVTLNVCDTASSVLLEAAGVQHAQIQIPMTRVDRIVDTEFGGRTPDLLKLDVQGYELEVLRGAERVLPHVQMVLAEVNLLDIHSGVPLLAEVIAWLDARNFVAFDVCGLTRRPLDGALWQMDVLFVARESPLRSDKRWGR